MTIWLVIIRLVEDSVGLPKPVCCHQQPAYIGVLAHIIIIVIIIIIIIIITPKVMTDTIESNE
jgi:hypothetical protein